MKNWDILCRTCFHIAKTNHAQAETFLLPFLLQSSKFDDEIWREIKVFDFCIRWQGKEYFSCPFRAICATFWWEWKRICLKKIAWVNSEPLYTLFFAFFPFTSFKLTQQDGSDLLNGQSVSIWWLYVNEHTKPSSVLPNYIPIRDFWKKMGALSSFFNKYSTRITHNSAFVFFKKGSKTSRRCF